MLTIKLTITDDQEKIADIWKRIGSNGDPFRVPFQLPDLNGKWLAISTGYTQGQPETLVIELYQVTES
jgi:hypothetical protein